jgi:hypothetical protein
LEQQPQSSPSTVGWQIISILRTDKVSTSVSSVLQISVELVFKGICLTLLNSLSVFGWLSLALLFPGNDHVCSSLSGIADLAERYRNVLLSADPNCKYDQVIEINLNELEPHVNGPFTPDLATPISKLGQTAKQMGWPEEIKVGK